MIILNLIQNTALLMALAIIQQLLVNSPAIRRLRCYGLLAPILSGFIFGGLGIVGMMTPLRFAPGIIFDGRSIILSVAGLFGGPVVAAVAASLCGAYRLWLGGAGALVGASVICEAAALGVLFYYLLQRNPRLMKNLPLLGFGILVHIVMLGLMLLPGGSSSAVLRQISLPVLVVYPVATMLLCRLFISLQENEINKVALRESEKNYRELVENANSIILRWESGGTITFFNEFAEKFFGFSKEEILGQSLFGTILPERDSANRDLHAMVLAISRNPEKFAQNENENMRKDGARVWISWTNSAICDADGNITEILAVGNDITRRKRAEKELHSMQQRLDFILGNLYAGVLSVAEDGTVEHVNQAFCDLFNLCETPADLRGLTSAEMLKKILPCYASPEEAHGLIRQVIAQGEPVRGEEMPMRDGRFFMVDHVPLSAGGRSCGRIWHHQDITERKRMEKALQLSEAKYRKLFEMEADALLPLVAESGAILDANPAAVALYGYSRDELLGMRNVDLSAEPEQTGAATITAFSEGVLTIPLRYHRKKDGTVFPAEIKVVSFVLNDRPALLTTIRDITDLKRAEKELQAKNDELIHFNYTVSHDLKSPLVTIKTFLGYLEQDMAKADTAHVAQDLAYLHRAAGKMDAMLEELLALSRIGRAVNPPVEALLQDIVREGLELVAGRITGRGVQVVVGQEPIMLYCDRPRMVAVFQNLVDNAVKFMGDQSDPLIEIGAEIKDGEIVCFVRDNGMGIDPRHMNKLFGIFEKFNPEIEGTGLGLALVKRIIEVHGGRIWVESEGPGKGVCFWFAVPGKKI